MQLKPLDFVATPKGAVALVTEVNVIQGTTSYSIRFFSRTNHTGEKCAWWYDDEGLIYLDNLPNLLASGLVHPFSSDKEPSKVFAR